jgi:WD40 repeat protein
MEKTLETFDRDKDKDSPRYFHVVSSRDGTTIAASFTSWKKVAFGAIKVWEAKTGKLLQSFTVDTQLLGAIALSPDGKKLIGGTCRDRNCKVFVWDVPSGTLDKTLEAEDANMSYDSAAISDDGKWAVAGGIEDQKDKVIVWELETGKVKHEWTDNSMERSVTAVALSPDGQMVAAGGNEDPMVRMWDMQTGKRKHLLEGPKTYPFVCGLAFSPDGRSLAIAGKISVKLWDVAKEKEQATFQEPEGYGPGRVAFAPDGRTLAIGGGVAGTIRFLQIATSPERRSREP